MAKSTPRSVPRTAEHPTTPRRDYWRTVIEECRRSGLRQVEFCRRRGIPPGTLSFWKHTLSREARRSRRPSAPGPAPTPERLSFVPIRIAAARPPSDEARAGAPSPWDGEIEIALGRDPLVRVRGQVNAESLRQVLLTLGARRC